VVRLLRFVWWLVRWLWGALVIGGLIAGPLFALATTGTTGVANWQSWPITLLIVAYPLWAGGVLALAGLFTLTAYLADRSALREEALDREYVLERVDRLDPDQYVPRYVPGVYLGRRDAATGQDADAAARHALQAAATRPQPFTAEGPLGVCVFGRPTEGKTRLAWQAMQAVLPRALFLKWPYATPQTALDIGALRGGGRGRRQVVVLWLDDLSKYRPDEAVRLLDLPRRFADERVRLVVVATCRDGDDETSVRAQLGALLTRLTVIRPADISQALWLERRRLARGP
jgi:hypothetical protein